MNVNTLSFTVFEVFSFLGVVQSVYLIVHILFRTKSFKHVVVPVSYFLVLCMAFLFDTARSNFGEFISHYEIVVWFLWVLCIPLSVLVIIQMAKITELPSFYSFCALFTVPIAFLLSKYFSMSLNSSCEIYWKCTEFYELLNITGAVAGAISLLFIWSHRTLFSDVLKQKAGKERYWLILSLITLNVAFIAGFLLQYDSEYLVLLRTILGLAFIYLVSTSLLRIYPNALHISYKAPIRKDVVNNDKDIAEKIKQLLTLDKIYHEATYSRTDLAQELGISEANVSRVINVYFGKSFPQLLNEYRVEDSKHLLLDTDASIKVISEEVGFNSLPSFNRCFKDIVGQSPSSYRSNIIK